jgi:anti-anti-sigma factor
MSFDAFLGFSGPVASINLAGECDDTHAQVLRSLVDQAVRRDPQRLVLRVRELRSLAPAGVRCLAFAQQHLAPGVEILVDGAGDEVRRALRLGGFDQAVTFIEEMVALGGTA